MYLELHFKCIWNINRISNTSELTCLSALNVTVHVLVPHPHFRSPRGPLKLSRRVLCLLRPSTLLCRLFVARAAGPLCVLFRWEETPLFSSTRPGRLEFPPRRSRVRRSKNFAFSLFSSVFYCNLTWWVSTKHRFHCLHFLYNVLHVVGQWLHGPTIKTSIWSR